jgi:lactose/L-arabinose transport system permease protein
VIKLLRQGPKYLFLGIFAIFSIFPLYFMLVSATNSSKDVLDSRLLPGGELFANFAKLTGAQNLWGAMWASFIVAVASRCWR